MKKKRRVVRRHRADPSQSMIMQMGVAFIIVAAIVLVAFAFKNYT